MAFTDKLKTLSEILINIDKNLGITRFICYTLFILVILGIFNFSTILEYGMKIQTQIEKKDHERRLELRDKLVSELNPLLIELRSSTGASRLLYFEYHNSTENFAGIPFKFANLVLTNQDYDCPGYNPEIYKDVNSGLISEIYADLLKHKIVINKGLGYFNSRYPSLHNFFSSTDGSVQQMFINIPGVNSPLGMIVLEWMEDNIKSDQEWEIVISKVDLEIPRINAVISQNTP